MAVVAVCSAKGAPGVTTTAMLLAALWPRPVLLVDADPAGGDVALRLPGEDGRPLDPGRGLLTLLPVARRGLRPDALLEHAQTVSGGTPVLAGLDGPEQAEAAGSLWDTLATAATGAPCDVVVDAGRAHARSVHLPLLRRADAVLILLRPGVAAVVHTREQLRTLAPALRRADGSGPRLGVVVVHDVKDRAEIASAADAVRAPTPEVEALGPLAFDPAAAGMFEGRPVSRPERTMLVRSGRELVSRVAGRLPSLAATRAPATPPGGAVPARTTRRSA